MQLPSLVSLLLVVGTSLSAQAITGRVVDSIGNGVGGVNIDAIDLNDGSPATLSNDGTDSSGFFTTDVDSGAGVYEFFFYPSPASHLVVGVRNNVVVTGTTNLGNVALQQGVALSGTTKRVGGTPVANVNVDVVDVATNQQVILQNDKTSAFGTFTVTVPMTPIEVQLRTDGISPLLAPQALELTMAVDTNLGTLTLQDGVVLSGTVERSSGPAVSGADIDVMDGVTGIKLFTPGDNTDSSGFFDVVVPTGTFDVEVCPPTSAGLVGKAVLGVVVSGNTSMGTILLQSGVVLSGTIRDYLAAPVPTADVDVRISSTGVAVVTCNDNADATGHYSVVVPTGTFDLTFTPPGAGCTSGLGLDVDLGVVVGGNTTHDAVLPQIPAATASTFAGDGINPDTVAAVKVVLGGSWTAPLTIGHTHGAAGTVVLKVRTNTVNGPNVTSSIGGRVTELLISGPLLTTIAGSHNGSTGGIAAQPIPNSLGLAGVTWSAQYTVAGGGFVDLSRAVFGVVGCQ